MADDEYQKGNGEDGFEASAHEACFVFRAGQPQSLTSTTKPPKKRQKIAETKHIDRTTWPKLCNGTEPPESIQLRHNSFKEIWSHHQDIIDKIANQVDSETLHRVREFVQSEQGDSTSSKIKTGLILSGADTKAQSLILDHWKRAQDGRPTTRELVVQLPGNQARNVQTALKNIIRDAITQVSGPDGYQSFISKHKRLIPVTFDLELLELFAVDHNIERVVLSISDIEGFDMMCLSDLITILSTRTSKINFVLLIGVSTTVELLESRLPRSMIRLLDTQIFELNAQSDKLFQIYRTIQDDPKSPFTLGPAATSVLSEMSKVQGMTPSCFGKAIKYIYMSHFFANPLSIMLSAQASTVKLIGPICDAIRRTKSFQDYCQALLKSNEKDRKRVRSLLDDDGVLFSAAQVAVKDGQERSATALRALRAFQSLLPLLSAMDEPLNSFDREVEHLASLDEFEASDVYQDWLDEMQKTTSTKLLQILSDPSLHPDIQGIHERISAFQGPLENTSIKSKQAPTSGQAFLHKSQPTLAGSYMAKLEKEYTEILDLTISDIHTYLINNIPPTFTAQRPSTIASSNTEQIKPKSIWTLPEATIYNHKSNLQTTLFAPRPRQNLERALTRPADYLGCECCFSASSATTHDNDEEGEDAVADRKLAHPTYVLFTLINEAGTVINVRDLWDAFHSRLDPTSALLFSAEDEEDAGSDKDNENDDDEVDGERVAAKQKKIAVAEKERLQLGLFYRSMAELKMLGLVKTTKRRPTKVSSKDTDCVFIAKTVWLGL